MRTIAVLVCTVLPTNLKRVLFQRCFGWKIDRTARIGLSLFLDVQHVELGPHVRIGHGNVFRNLRHLRVGEHASIGQWNWITTAHEFLTAPEMPERGTLTLGGHAAVTSRHYVDCAGGVRIGAFTTVAGVRSTIFSHQIDTKASRQTARPVEIGEYCFIGSNVCVTPDARIPDRCVIAMGSVVTGELPEPNTLYGGVPARAIKSLPDSAYFHRKEGYVRS